ncbi:MAG: hypothetical protein ACLFRD_05715 [Nitriliruptoraceae bacterium]
MSAVPAPLRRRSQEAEQRHLEVVEPPAVRHTLAYALVIITVLGAAIFGAVSFNALAAAAAVEARALEAEVADAERSYGQLVADVAALEDPARIREAAEDLGMVPAGSVRYVSVERSLPADGAVPPTDTGQGSPDPLKPLLSAEQP